MKFLNTGFFVTIDSNESQLSNKAFSHITNALLKKIADNEVEGLDYDLYKNTIGREHFIGSNSEFYDYLDVTEEDLFLSMEHECGVVTLITEEPYDVETKEKIIQNVIVPIMKKFVEDYIEEKLFFIDAGYNDTYEEIDKHHVGVH